jgi:hypothetical protein
MAMENQKNDGIYDGKVNRVRHYLIDNEIFAQTYSTSEKSQQVT